MGKRTVESQLDAAELWVPAPAAASGSGAAEPLLVAGWEDADPFCAMVCTTQPGLEFCRRCPTSAVARVLTTGRPTRDVCPGGVRLLAFPTPRRATLQAVAVLRVAPPAPGTAERVARQVRIAPGVLRQAAGEAPGPNARASLAAAHRLSTPRGLLEWHARQRALAAGRRRAAAAALAQMMVTSAEMEDLIRVAGRERARAVRSQRELERLLRESLLAADRERLRIGHLLHDTAAQTMISAFRFLEAAATVWQNDPGAARDHLGTGQERLAAAIREMRRVLAGLLPAGPDRVGLAAAIAERLDWLGGESGVGTELLGELPRLEPWVEQALYGMAVEAITNAARHAAANRLRVALGTRRGRAVIEVRDDGRGFDVSAATRARPGGDGLGLGLAGIVRQAAWLGGRATVRSRPAEGTAVRISIPLQRHLLPAGAAPRDRAEASA